MGTAELTVIVTVTIGLIGFCVTIFLYIHARFSSITERTDLKIDAIREASAKNKEQLRGEIGALLTAQEHRLQEVERETIRKDDLREIENRLLTQVDKLDGKFERFSTEIGRELKEVSFCVAKLVARRDMGLEENRPMDRRAENYT